MSRPLGVLILDKMTSAKMWPAWVGVFLLWLGLSIGSVYREGFKNADMWHVIYLTGLIGVISGIIGFHMLWRTIARNERKQHKMRYSSRS